MHQMRLTASDHPVHDEGSGPDHGPRSFRTETESFRWPESSKKPKAFIHWQSMKLSSGVPLVYFSWTIKVDPNWRFASTPAISTELSFSPSL
jgi:hypothetical protein